MDVTQNSSILLLLPLQIMQNILPIMSVWINIINAIQPPHSWAIKVKFHL
jgi:hypothetical protein